MLELQFHAARHVCSMTSSLIAATFIMHLDSCRKDSSGHICTPILVGVCALIDEFSNIDRSKKQEYLASSLGIRLFLSYKIILGTKRFTAGKTNITAGPVVQCPQGPRNGNRRERRWGGRSKGYCGTAKLCRIFARRGGPANEDTRPVGGELLDCLAWTDMEKLALV